MTNTARTARLPHLTTAPILAARMVVRGDVSSARAILNTHMWGSSYRVSEIRALIGAVREANRRYGCDIDWREVSGLFVTN